MNVIERPLRYRGANGIIRTIPPCSPREDDVQEESGSDFNHLLDAYNKKLSGDK